MTREPVKQHVLVVDDDPITLEVAKERLERAGYEVTTREHVLGTAGWIAHNLPDAVLLDVAMPALSGNELALLITQRSLGDRVAVILHSSKSAAELRPLVESSGAVGAIEKTSDDRLFMTQFNRFLRSHALRRQAG